MIPFGEHTGFGQVVGSVFSVARTDIESKYFVRVWARNLTIMAMTQPHAHLHVFIICGIIRRQTIRNARLLPTSPSGAFSRLPTHTHSNTLEPRRRLNATSRSSQHDYTLLLVRQAAEVQINQPS